MASHRIEDKADLRLWLLTLFMEIYHPEDLNSNHTHDYLIICSIPDASGGVYILAGDVTCTEDGAPGSGLVTTDLRRTISVR